MQREAAQQAAHRQLPRLPPLVSGCRRLQLRCTHCITVWMNKDIENKDLTNNSQCNKKSGCALGCNLFFAGVWLRRTCEASSRVVVSPSRHWVRRQAQDVQQHPGWQAAQRWSGPGTPLLVAAAARRRCCRRLCFQPTGSEQQHVGGLTEAGRPNVVVVRRPLLLRDGQPHVPAWGAMQWRQTVYGTNKQGDGMEQVHSKTASPQLPVQCTASQPNKPTKTATGAWLPCSAPAAVACSKGVVLQDGVEGCLHLCLLLMLQPQVHALLARHQAREADLPVHAHVAIHRWVHASHAHRLRHAQVDRVPRVAALQGAGGGQGWIMCAWCRHTWLEQQQLSMAGWPSKQLAVC